MGGGLKMKVVPKSETEALRGGGGEGVCDEAAAEGASKVKVATSGSSDDIASGAPGSSVDEAK